LRLRVLLGEAVLRLPGGKPEMASKALDVELAYLDLGIGAAVRRALAAVVLDSDGEGERFCHGRGVAVKPCILLGVARLVELNLETAWYLEVRDQAIAVVLDVVHEF